MGPRLLPDTIQKVRALHRGVGFGAGAESDCVARGPVRGRVEALQ